MSASNVRGPTDYSYDQNGSHFISMHMSRGSDSGHMFASSQSSRKVSYVMLTTVHEVFGDDPVPVLRRLRGKQSPSLSSVRTRDLPSPMSIEWESQARHTLASVLYSHRVLLVSSTLVPGGLW
eukprot:1426967-Amphidinium_carterae.1